MGLTGDDHDRAALRREFPDVAFHDFESWAKAQDWKSLLQTAQDAPASHALTP